MLSNAVVEFDRHFAKAWDEFTPGTPIRCSLARPRPGLAWTVWDEPRVAH